MKFSNNEILGEKKVHSKWLYKDIQLNYNLFGDLYTVATGKKKVGKKLGVAEYHVIV